MNSTNREPRNAILLAKVPYDGGVGDRNEKPPTPLVSKGLGKNFISDNCNNNCQEKLQTDPEQDPRG